MKERYLMIRSHEDGTFEFVPGVDGMDGTITPEEYEKEIKQFWNDKETIDDLTLIQIIQKIIVFFQGEEVYETN